jgi:hypothetical protein
LQIFVQRGGGALESRYGSIWRGGGGQKWPKLGDVVYGCPPGKVRNYQNTDQGNQVQLTYVRDHPFFRAPFAPKKNN